MLVFFNANNQVEATKKTEELFQQNANLQGAIWHKTLTPPFTYNLSPDNDFIAFHAVLPNTSSDRILFTKTPPPKLLSAFESTATELALLNSIQLTLSFARRTVSGVAHVESIFGEPIPNIKNSPFAGQPVRAVEGLNITGPIFYDPEKLSDDTIQSVWHKQGLLPEDFEDEPWAIATGDTVFMLTEESGIDRALIHCAPERDKTSNAPPRQTKTIDYNFLFARSPHPLNHSEEAVATIRRKMLV